MTSKNFKEMANIKSVTFLCCRENEGYIIQWAHVVVHSFYPQRADFKNKAASKLLGKNIVKSLHLMSSQEISKHTVAV